MTFSEEMEEMGMTISMMGAELLATKKELKGALAALEETQHQLTLERERTEYWGGKEAEAQQTIARQREALEFYASGKHIELNAVNEMVSAESGYKARAALGETQP